MSLMTQEDQDAIYEAIATIQKHGGIVVQLFTIDTLASIRDDLNLTRERAMQILKRWDEVCDWEIPDWAMQMLSDMASDMETV